MARVPPRALDDSGPVLSTVYDAIAWATPLLAGAEVPSPRLDAEVLLGHVLGWRRSSLYARPEHRLTPEQVRSFAAAIGRRQNHEPVPYITQRREFYALEFAIERGVLIPRPETELLVERVLSLASLRQGGSALFVADIGTGSGIIAISVAVHCPRAVVLATDISEIALRITARNAARHGVGDRVHVLLGDLLEPLAHRVHVIVANLPYVPSDVIPTLARDVLEYEPLEALDGGSDGLRPIERLMVQAGDCLLPQGAVVLEIGAGQGETVCALASSYYPGAQVSLYRDYAGLDRLVQVQP